MSVEGPVLYGFSEKAKFYGINLLCELDAPGEYYLDRRASSSSFGTLYFWPPSDLALSEAFVSMGDYTVLLGDTASQARNTARQLDAFAALQARTFASATGHSSVRASVTNHSHTDAVSSAFTRLRQAEDLDRDARRNVRAAVRRNHSETVGATAVPGWGNWDFYWEESIRTLRRTSPMSGTLDFVSISGFGIHFAQVAAVRVVKGRRLSLESLEITNHGGVGLVLDGTHLKVLATEVAHVGCGALQVSGGSDMCLGWCVSVGVVFVCVRALYACI